MNSSQLMVLVLACSSWWFICNSTFISEKPQDGYGDPLVSPPPACVYCNPSLPQPQLPPAGGTPIYGAPPPPQLPERERYAAPPPPPAELPGGGGGSVIYGAPPPPAKLPGGGGGNMIYGAPPPPAMLPGGGGGGGSVIYGGPPPPALPAGVNCPPVAPVACCQNSPPMPYSYPNDGSNYTDTSSSSHFSSNSYPLMHFLLPFLFLFPL